MSVLRVAITEAEEKYAPPEREIEISVGSGLVYITVFSGSQENVPSDRKKEYEVPTIRLHDLICALNAFGIVSQGLLVSEGVDREASRVLGGDLPHDPPLNEDGC